MITAGWAGRFFSIKDMHQSWVKINFAGWPNGTFMKKLMPKSEWSKVFVFDFVIVFQNIWYQYHIEDNMAIFSFLLLAPTSQLIADSNAAYPTDSQWHSSISGIARCWIKAGLASLQSVRAIPPAANSTAICAANAAGAEVQKRGYKNEVALFFTLDTLTMTWTTRLDHKTIQGQIEFIAEMAFAKKLY